jgi:hypothetical protein
MSSVIQPGTLNSYEDEDVAEQKSRESPGSSFH